MAKKLKNALDSSARCKLNTLINQYSSLIFQEYSGAPMVITEILPAFQNTSRVNKDENVKKHYEELCEDLQEYDRLSCIFVKIVEQLDELRELCEEVGL